MLGTLLGAIAGSRQEEDSTFGSFGSAFMSGIPFLGQGFAAQQNRRFQKESAREAMAFSAKEASINRAFQQKMASTSYRRKMHDLEQAGLNPILAAGGAGAATPAGNVGTSSSASGAMGSGASDSKDIMKSIMNNEAKEAQARIAKTNEEKRASSNLADKLKTEKELSELTRKAVQAEADYNEKLHRTKNPKFDYVFDKATQGLSSGAQVIGAGALLKGLLNKMFKHKPSKGIQHGSKQYQHSNDYLY